MRARVLFDVSILTTDTRDHGIGRYVAELARAELEGVRYLVSAAPLELEDDGQRAVERALARPPVHRWRWSYALRLGLARAARAARAGAVHLPHTGATPLALGVPRVVTCHDLVPLAYPEAYAEWQSGGRLGRWLLDLRRVHGAAKVIAPSQRTAGELRRRLRLVPRAIAVIPHAVSPFWGEGHPTASDSFPTPAGRYALYVGDADWRKNVPCMLRALASTPPGVELWWAGGLPSERRAEVKARAAQLGVSERLRLLGYVTDVTLRALYRRAIATLLVSREEGFGLPVLEAMAAGCPVIVSPALREVAGEAGRYVHDDRGLSAALAELLEPSVRERQVAAGRSRAERFSPRAQRCATEAIYRQVTAGG